MRFAVSGVQRAQVFSHFDMREQDLDTGRTVVEPHYACAGLRSQSQHHNFVVVRWEFLSWSRDNLDESVRRHEVHVFRRLLFAVVVFGRVTAIGALFSHKVGFFLEPV
jgi:hypothetical protein